MTVPLLSSLPDAVAVIEARRSPDYRTVVGLVGPPGAGKSTIAAALVEELGTRAALLPMDGFHLPQARLVELGRRNRMGAPDTFDVDGLLRTLIAVRRGFGPSGQTVLAPGFDRSREEADPASISIRAEADCVVVEGNYLLLTAGGWERIGALIDLSFFVDLDRATRIARLTARHEQFGKTPAEARAWALGPDESNAGLIETGRERADYWIALG